MASLLSSIAEQIGVSGRTLRISPRAQRRIAWIFILLGLPLSVAPEFAPLFNIDAALAKARISDTFQKQIASMTSSGESELLVYAPVNNMFDAEFSVSTILSPNNATPPETHHVHAQKLAFRYDRAIVFLGLYAIVVLTARTVLIKPRFSRIGQVESDGLTKAHEMVAPNVSRLIGDKVVTSAVAMLQANAKAAGIRADILFQRSTLLLAGGVLMAFVGVAVFYVTLPDTIKDSTVSISASILGLKETATATPNKEGAAFAYLQHAIRPAGVLFFVEAIAWFLLRQYRALIEDYKWFHRIYMKRCNYLAALLLLEKDKVRKEDMFLAAALVNEDLSGKLRKGETTESLESVKTPESGPVAQLLGVVSSFYNHTEKKHTEDLHGKSPGQT